MAKSHGKSRPPQPVVPSDRLPSQRVGMQIQQQTTQITQSPVPPGEVLDKLAPHIDKVGERWMCLFEGNVAHQQTVELETLRINGDLNNKGLENQKLTITEDSRNLRRAQWIAGGLVLFVLLVFVFLIGTAAYLFLHDKVWPAAVFTALAGALGVGFRSILMGYLGKPDQAKKKS